MKSEFWIENKHRLWGLMVLVLFFVFLGGLFLLKNSKYAGVFAGFSFVILLVVLIVVMYLVDTTRQIVCFCGGICRYNGMDMDILMYTCEKCGYNISEYGKSYNWYSLPGGRYRNSRQY